MIGDVTPMKMLYQNMYIFRLEYDRGYYYFKLNGNNMQHLIARPNV